jgi:hypothetical protein
MAQVAENLLNQHKALSLTNPQYHTHTHKKKEMRILLPKHNPRLEICRGLKRNI